MQDFTTAIRFDKVTFRYEEANVLTNFTLEVPKGKTVALVGSRGVERVPWQTSLLVFYDVNEGQVLIDGVDVRDMQTGFAAPPDRCGIAGFDSF